MDTHKTIVFPGLDRLGLACDTQTAEYGLKVNFKTIEQHNFNTSLNTPSSTCFLAHHRSIVC